MKGISEFCRLQLVISWPARGEMRGFYDFSGLLRRNGSARGFNRGDILSLVVFYVILWRFDDSNGKVWNYFGVSVHFLQI